MLDLGGFVPLLRFQYCFCCQTHCKWITTVTCLQVLCGHSERGLCDLLLGFTKQAFFVVILFSGSILLNCCHFLEPNTLLVTKLEAEVPLTELCECQVKLRL